MILWIQLHNTKIAALLRVAGDNEGGAALYMKIFGKTILYTSFPTNKMTTA